MVGIYADKGITGTSVKKRDEFNRLMRHCKQGKVDMIITKSVACFARNTLDCLKHTRKPTLPSPKMYLCEYRKCK